MVSVIIPTLNEARGIGAVLERVLAQPGDKEIIVVDGGSSDGTLDLAARYATVLQGRQGRASQMNLGAARARGDILLFLHADTLLPAGALAEVERAMSRSGVVGGRFKVRLDQPGLAYRVVGHSINLRDRLFRGFTGDQAIFIRASVFRDLGGYRELPLMEDLELSRRVCRRGKVVRLPLSVVTSARRWRNGGVARTVLLMWILRLLYVLGCPPARLKRLYGDTR